MPELDTTTQEIAERIARSVQEQLDQSNSSRRRFMSRSALVGGTLLALGGATGFALAQEDDAGGSTQMFDDVLGTDIDVLNYALSLEHVEDVFYREALEQFTAADLADAEALTDASDDDLATVYGYIQAVADHEATHVAVLTQAVELLGGTPAEEGTYDFGVETVDDFFALAQVLENTGVAAYRGAAPFVQSPDLLGAALSIHSVEARHAAMFNALNGASPFPDAFDAPASQQDVLDAVSQFVVS